MRFVRGLQDVFNKFARYGENLLGFLGKTFGCESAGDAHLFIICARPGEVFAGVKGGALFCALDKSRRGFIIVDEKGTLRQAVSPGYVKISSGLATHRNRHLAEWRFLLFSF